MTITTGTSAVLTSNTSFWAINATTFEQNPSSDGSHSDDGEHWHGAQWGSSVNPFRVSRSAAARGEAVSIVWQHSSPPPLRAPRWGDCNRAMNDWKILHLFHFSSLEMCSLFFSAVYFQVKRPVRRDVLFVIVCIFPLAVPAAALV